MKRRTLIQSLPFLGAVAAIPTVADEMSLEEKIDHHQSELRALLAEKHQIGGWRIMATSEQGIKGPMETFGL